MQPLTAILVQPAHAAITPGASRGFWTASRGKVRIGDEQRPLVVDRREANGSLLPHVFNEHWCYMLNRLHRGHDIAYFAMLHADVEPFPGWLDILINELEWNHLDLLSAVVPIKSDNGLTSCALDSDDRNNYRVHCRLTMKEVFNLPETFTSDDAGRPLLVNTGCWVCKVDRRWVDKVHFEINSRIVFNRTLDSYLAEVEPEDWYFSRLCHELGLRVGATRKVKLEHSGPKGYANTSPWGTDEYDRVFLPESVLEEPPIRFPYDVDGWLLPEEGYALADLCRGKRVLEIGSYCGRSTICIAQTASGVVSIDPHDGTGTPKPRDTRGEFRGNLSKHGVDRKVASVLPGIPLNGKFDVVFIDGAHDYESVQADIAFALEHLRPDGLIAFHDYREEPGEHDLRWDPGVTQAVNEFIESGAELISRHATVAVVKPPSLVLEESYG